MIDSISHDAVIRSRWIGMVAIILLVATVMAGTYLGSQTREQFRSVEESWMAYSGDAGRKGAWISAIRGHLGYGGIIHHFKNFVLRQDDFYLVSTRDQLDQFNRVTAAYLAADIAADERAALAAIVRTVREYEAMLPIAIQAASEGWEVTRTDTLVRVDDTEALNAVEQLEGIWQQSRDQSTERMLQAVNDGQNLIGLGFAALGALMAAAIAIGTLLILLVRDMRAAVSRMSDELVERQRLQRSEGRLATAVEQSPTTIVITDIDARILYANRRFEEMTGWQRDEITGHTPSFLQTGDTGPEAYAEIRARLTRGESWHGVFRNRRKDGGSYWAETTILPLIGPDGSVQNFIGIAEDVTEKRRAREQMVRAQKLEVVGLLAGGIAHDFNNILTTIIGSAHLARQDAPEGSDIAQEIEQIRIAARRAQGLVNELLTFARRAPGKPRPTDLVAMLNEVARMLRASIPPTLELYLIVPTKPLPVMADPSHLHQIVMNLCRNAAEAIGAASGRITLRAESLNRDEAPEGLTDNGSGCVRLEVNDTGPGMSEEVRGRVFEPFFTTKPLGKGSGLGLAVVAGLVDEMRGQIEVESTPGKGTSFCIVLPAASTLDPEMVESKDELPRGHERIMLVDDQTEVASVFRRVLMRLGYRVEAFTAPGQALDWFRADSTRIDLLVTDMVMPEMDGSTMAAEMRLLRPDLPVIFCTGYNPSGISLEGVAPTVLNKPVEPEALARCIRENLDSKPDAVSAGKPVNPETQGSESD